ncbi:type II toxin-antitoxin system RelE/ParE family toxin [Alkalimarinus coralli]|uniref:type II toxin-antitoxin system RelE/ParE family toxin n=1 Tax=Alkalimarinus coralli TaxID=2935863 RepID=UPI0035131A4B
MPENPAPGHSGRIHGARELVIPNTRYIVPYRVRPRLHRIEILRIFHTSRRLPRGGGDKQTTQNIHSLALYPNHSQSVTTWPINNTPLVICQKSMGFLSRKG